MRSTIILATALAVLVGPSLASSADRCPKSATCRTITVALDHSGATPGTLPLSYARVPATGVRRGTVVLLSGGPGEAGIPFTREFTEILRGVQSRYDLVFLD